MVPTNCILCWVLGNISQTFPLQDVFGELVVVLLMVPMDSGAHGGDLVLDDLDRLYQLFLSHNDVSLCGSMRTPGRCW